MESRYNLFYQIPQNWAFTVDMCVYDVYNKLREYNKPESFIEFLEIKEKMGRLRIYYCFPSTLESDVEEPMIGELYSEVDKIIDKYEKIIIELERSTNE